MTTLNKYAVETSSPFAVHACTGITGFALIRALLEMTGTGYTAHLYSAAIPFMHTAYDAAGEFLLTASGTAQQKFCSRKCTV